MSVKSRRNAKYTLAFLDLLRTPFSYWKAYSKGIIDKKGNVINKPMRPDEDWTRFHTLVAKVKNVMNQAALNSPELSKLHRTMKVIKEEYDVSLDDTEHSNEFPVLFSEEMVSGDAGGNPENIAAGTNSGAVVYKSPKTLGKTKRKKKMTEVMNFNQFVESIETARIEEEKSAQEQQEKMNEVFSFEFKAMGGNTLVVEATELELKSVKMTGHTTQKNVTVSGIEEALKGGQESVLAYIKEATNLVWKAI